MQRLTEAASTRSLRRQLKTIRRKIEVAEHDLAAALPVGGRVRSTSSKPSFLGKGWFDTPA